MRTAPLAGLVVLLVATHANAQPATAYRAVVTDAEVTLRAGPSDRYADTGTLRRGAAVIVEKDEGNGWLAITAPYGSVSWVAAQFIEDPTPDRPTPKNVFVHTEDEVTLAIGKAGVPQPLDVRRVKLKNGDGLLLLGPKVKFADKTWYPVAPPAGDVRYLPKTAVQFEKASINNFTVRVADKTGDPVPPAASPTIGPTTSLPGPGVAPAGGGNNKPAVNHPLWTQAEAAEREGRTVEAEKLYFDLAAQMNAPGGDHDIANLCYTRIHSIREKKRNASAPLPTTPPRTTGVLQPPAKDDRGVRAGTPQPLPPATDERPRWSGPGTLRRTALTLDGRSAYALESSPGVVVTYVIAGQGVDLERSLGKRVDVYGTSQTRSGLSKPCVVATTVEAAQ
jgi:Bacterial SH3 domain